MKVCNQPGCPKLATMAGTRCDTHHTPAWANSQRAKQLPPNWQALRRTVLHRDGHRCTNCGSTTRLEVDHTGDPNDHRPHMLRTLCHTCHQQVTNTQAAEARRAAQ